MNLRKRFKTLSLVGLVILLFGIAFIPVIVRKFKLQVQYSKYPDRTKASQYITEGGKLMAEAIILHDTQRMKYVDENYYHVYGIDTSRSLKSATKTQLAMEWQCHECFDLILSRTGTPTIDLLNSTIYQDDPYYFDVVVERVEGVNVNNDEKSAFKTTSPLENAVIYEKLDMVTALINKGANINNVLYDATALDVARIRKNTEIEQLLLKHGAKTAEELGVKVKIGQ